MARSIVILHPGGLGDLLLAVPAIRGLRKAFPGRQVLLCGQADAAEFLSDCGLVDRWLSVQTTACTALFAGAASDDPLLGDWLRRCDVAVAWTRDDAGTLAAALRACGAVTAVVQSPFDSTLKSAHQSDRFVEIVGGQAGQVPVAALSTSDALRAEAEVYLAACGIPWERPLAMIHPGSGSPHKCVKPEIVASVVEGLQPHGLEPLLLEGPADHAMVERLLGQFTQPPILLRALPLHVLAGMLSKVELFLGHDSGVTHLSALVGTPTVALFGPTDAGRWAPRGSAVTVLRGKPCECTSWDAVRTCPAKPCLDLSPAVIIDACVRTRSVPLNPRIC